MAEAVIEDAREYAELKRLVEQHGGAPANVLKAIANWEAKSAQTPEQKKQVDSRLGEAELQEKMNEGAEELNYFGAANQAYNWAQELGMDSQARIDMLDEVAQTDIPGVEAMTLDERVLAEQDVLWKSLNPVQKALIGVGRGIEQSIDSIAPFLGTVDEQKELIMDLVDPRHEDIGDVGELLGMGAAPVAGLATVGAGFKMAMIPSAVMLVARVAKTAPAVMKVGVNIISNLARKYGQEAAETGLRTAMSSKASTTAIKNAVGSTNPAVGNAALNIVGRQAETVAKVVNNSKAGIRQAQQEALRAADAGNKATAASRAREASKFGRIRMKGQNQASIRARREGDKYLSDKKIKTAQKRKANREAKKQAELTKEQVQANRNLRNEAQDATNFINFWSKELGKKLVNK